MVSTSFAPQKMIILQAFFTDGNEFTFIAGGAAAFGEPVDGRIPEQVFFPLHDPLYIWFEVIIFMDGYSFFKFLNGK